MEEASRALQGAYPGSALAWSVLSIALQLQGKDALHALQKTVELAPGDVEAQPAITYDATAPAGSRYTYAGNTETQTVVVGNGITQAANVDVKNLETWLNKIDQTIETLSAPGLNPADPAVRASVTGALDGTDEGMELLSGKIAIFGGAQNILSTLDNNLDNVSLSNNTALLDLKKADIGAAAIDLTGYQTALEATYKAYSKVGSLSLFDLL